MKDCASEIKTLTAIKSQVASGEATAINGNTIDKLGFESGVFALQVGDTTGTPTRFGITFKVQESSGETAAAIATNWADVSGMTKTYSGETVATQGDLGGEINVDFKPLGRYVRCVATPTFTAGSSPKINIGAVVVLGEAKVVPI
jgi:hypothetical protein